MHALNRIAYYLERGAMDATDMYDVLDDVKAKLDAIGETAGAIEAHASKIAGDRLLFL